MTARLAIGDVVEVCFYRWEKGSTLYRWPRDGVSSGGRDPISEWLLGRVEAMHEFCFTVEITAPDHGPKREALFYSDRGNTWRITSSRTTA